MVQTYDNFHHCTVKRETGRLEKEYGSVLPTHRPPYLLKVVLCKGSVCGVTTNCAVPVFGSADLPNSQLASLVYFPQLLYFVAFH